MKVKKLSQLYGREDSDEELRAEECKKVASPEPKVKKPRKPNPWNEFFSSKLKGMKGLNKDKFQEEVKKLKEEYKKLKEAKA